MMNAACSLPASPCEDVVRAVREHGRYDVADPGLFRRLIWPRPVEPEKLSILVVDGEEQQAARIACANPHCKVLGWETSPQALAEAHALKQRYGLKNLRVQETAPRSCAATGQKFDYVLCGSVLAAHSEPTALLRTLRALLAPHGVVAGMLHSPYMRAGLHPLQTLFARLGINDDAAGRQLARAALDALPKTHPARAYAAYDTSLRRDAALGRTLLHGPERTWTAARIVEMAESAGLAFRRWLDKPTYDPRAVLPEGHPLLPLLLELPPAAQWSAVEALTQHIGCHRFFLCLPDTVASYEISFNDDRWLDYIPGLRPPVRIVRAPAPGSLQPARLMRNDWVFEISGPEIPLLEAVNGARRIREILKAYPLPLTVDEVHGLARRFFARMAEGDHLQFQTAALPARTSGKRKKHVRAH